MLNPEVSHEIYFGGIEECGKTKVLSCDAMTHIVLENTRDWDFKQGITITAWICPEKMERYTIVVGRPNSNRLWATPTLGLYFLESGQLDFGMFGSKKYRSEIDAKVTAGQWVFAACAWDRQTAKIYIDGELKGEKACTGKRPEFHAPFNVGCGNSPNPFLKGKLGEVRIYEQAISGKAINALYQASRNLYPENVTNEKPTQKTITVKAKRKPESEWRSYQTRTLDSFPDLKTSTASSRNSDGKVELSKYGGWKAKSSKATGFFRSEKIDGRWWLIDSEGHCFIHVGMACVMVGSSPKSIETYKKIYGNRQSWAASALELLRQNDFNGTGNWSDHKALRATSDPMPYTIRGDFLGKFGRTKGLWKRVPGHAGYLGDVPPIFAPGFEAFCVKEAESFVEYKDDPYLLGAFSDNEIILPDLDKFLALDPKDPLLKPSYDAAVDWLKKHRKTEEVLTEPTTLAERLEFAAYAFDRYYSIVSKAIRRVLPNHMYLGSRLHGPCYRNPLIVQSCGRYADVVSINYYGSWNPDAVKDWEKISGRPMMITEFYTKGEDSGLPNTTGAGWIVPTQADRGRFYQNFILDLLESKGCVGWHWFKYMDNDPDDKNAEPSNIDSNKGIVKVDFTPYPSILKAMKEINREVYPLTEYFDTRQK